MIANTVRHILYMTVVVLGILSAQAQEPATLRAMLASAGFEDGATGVGAHDLDRALTSSAFGTSADSFVAAYYFVDESPNQLLGPLRVSRFDRPPTGGSTRSDSMTRSAVPCSRLR